MTLNPEFQFTQSNLQDYIACPRRFELRYIEQRRWPALQSEPVLEQERQMLMGQRFHRMVQQFCLGIPADYAQLAAGEYELVDWWDQFVQSDPLASLPAVRYPEHSLSAQLEGYRITAKYDLLAVDPGNTLVIIDWKTGHAQQPAALKKRVQSRLYPYLLVEAGAYLNNGAAVQPEQVRMMYWFAADPKNPVVFAYQQESYLADREYIAGLIAEIKASLPGKFLLTLDERTCLFCVYRSLCGRGEKAGDWHEMEEEYDGGYPPLIDIDLDQIGEIAF